MIPEFFHHKLELTTGVGYMQSADVSTGILRHKSQRPYINPSIVLKYKVNGYNRASKTRKEPILPKESAVTDFRIRVL